MPNYTGFMRPEDANSKFSAGKAAVMDVLRRFGYDIPVEVMAVYGEGLNPTGTVDVRPLVHMQDGAGVAYEHGIIHGVPYIRIQGGQRAFICDPQVGDTGVIVVAGRDISRVKSTRQAAAPASFRTQDFADSIYFGGLLNDAPTEYIGFVGGDVVVKTNGQFIVDADGAQFNCGITATGDVVGNGKSLDNHVHSGVLTGGSNTGKPV